MTAVAEGDCNAPPLPIFVYGTLQPGGAGFVELGLEDRVACLGAAFVRGALYHLGDYPGAILHGDGLIRGQLLKPLDDGVLPLLDAYELYCPDDPDGSEYIRQVTLLVGCDARCWIYVYNCTVTDAPVISSGQWRP